MGYSIQTSQLNDNQTKYVKYIPKENREMILKEFGFSQLEIDNAIAEVRQIQSSRLKNLNLDTEHTKRSNRKVVVTVKKGKVGKGNAKSTHYVTVKKNNVTNGVHSNIIPSPLTQKMIPKPEKERNMKKKEGSRFVFHMFNI